MDDKYLIEAIHLEDLDSSRTIVEGNTFVFVIDNLKITVIITKQDEGQIVFI
jgi:hypothetical protein